MVVDGRTVKWAEYIDEATLGVTPTNPDMNAFPGEFIDAELMSGPETDTYNILKGASDTDPMSSGKTVVTGEIHGIKVTIKPNSLAWLPYILLGATTTTYATGKVHHPISIGLKADDEYCVYSGCVPVSAEWNFADPKKACTLVITYMCVDKTDWSSTDYIGTGSHGTPSGSDPYTLSDLTSFQYDGTDPATANIIIESFKMLVTNDGMDTVTDLSATAPSKIGDFSYEDRSINVDISVTAMKMGAHTDLITGADHTISFTCDSKAFTFSQLKWTNKPSVGLAAAKKVGMTYTSAGKHTRLAIA